MNFLCIDVGTTCCKAQVFGERGEILFYQSIELDLGQFEGRKCVDIAGVKNAVISLVKAAAKGREISSLAFSTMGESFVLLDKDDEILTYPMLYTDPSGEEEAQEVADKIGRSEIFARTGTTPAAMYSLYKFLWLKKHCPDKVRRAKKLMLICDYLGYLFTGKRMIDYGLAARTGVFDVYKKLFSAELCGALGVDIALFSEPMPTGTVVGTVRAQIARETGLSGRCVLVLGSHDQICATLGAGVTLAGQSADGMGTVECITAVFENPPKDIAFGDMGYCVVPYPNGLYCTYIFNYTSNAIVNWFRKDILHGYRGGKEEQFTYLESSSSPTDILLLPYFAGAATPYQDTNAKGAILNLTAESKDTDIYRAVLEGTSFEMKLNLETVKGYGIEISQITATGGGANSALWVQLKSDILKVPVRTLRSSEGGLCGLALMQAVATGLCPDFEAAKDIFVRYKGSFAPRTEHDKFYEQKYEKYKKLYRILKEIN